MDDLVRDLSQVPEDIRGAVRNNGGGHSNHTAFWKLMGPVGSDGVGGAPVGPIAEQIAADFGDFEAFKKTFNETTAKQFGSGWGWLVFASGKLKVITTANPVSYTHLDVYKRQLIHRVDPVEHLSVHRRPQQLQVLRMGPHQRHR